MEELVTLVCDVKQQYTQFGGATARRSRLGCRLASFSRGLSLPRLFCPPSAPVSTLSATAAFPHPRPRQACAPLAHPSFSWDTTSTTAFSCTSQIPAATLAAGLRPALVPTARCGARPPRRRRRCYPIRSSRGRKESCSPQLSRLPTAQGAESILKQEYKEGCNLKEALLLAVKVLNKTMDSTSLTSDRRVLPGEGGCK